MLKINTTKDGNKYGYRSYYMNAEDIAMLKFLTQFYGINPSALVRKLITEAYTICKLLPPKEPLE